MFGFLQQICILLSEPKVTAQSISTQIGTVLEDNGESLSIIVQPSEKFFKKAVIRRRYKSHEAGSIRLEIDESKKLSVQELKNVFGEYRESVRLHWHSPRRIIFYVNVPTSQYKCGIAADVKLGEQGIEDGTVTSLIIRY